MNCHRNATKDAGKPWVSYMFLFRSLWLFFAPICHFQDQPAGIPCKKIEVIFLEEKPIYVNSCWRVSLWALLLNWLQSRSAYVWMNPKSEFTLPFAKSITASSSRSVLQLLKKPTLVPSQADNESTSSLEWWSAVWEKRYVIRQNNLLEKTSALEPTSSHCLMHLLTVQP